AVLIHQQQVTRLPEDWRLVKVIGDITGGDASDVRLRVKCADVCREQQRDWRRQRRFQSRLHLLRLLVVPQRLPGSLRREGFEDDVRLFVPLLGGDNAALETGNRSRGTREEV